MARTKTIQDYEAEIIALHNDNSPDSQKKLDYKLGKWEPLLKKQILVAQNEQQPWTDEEIGISTAPMPTKNLSGHNQVGDYFYEILRDGREPITGSLLVERKGGECGIEDLYGTLMDSRQRERFYREIARFGRDPRFSKMIIMIEGTLDEFLEYVPEVYVFRWNLVPGVGTKTLIRYLQRYYQIRNVKPGQVHKLENGRQLLVISPPDTVLIQIEPGDTAGLFINGKRRDTLVVKQEYRKKNLYQHKGASRNSRISTIAGLFLRGVSPQWCGSREGAVELYRQLIRQSIIKDYARILGLEN